MIKKILVKLIFSTFLTFISLNVNALDISITHAAFQYQNNKYLEVYIQVIGSTVDFIEKNDLKQAEVEFTILLKQGDEIKSFDKFSLKSPLSKEELDFIGLRRFRVENGEYTLEVKAIDKNNTKNIFESRNEIEVNLSTDEICMSDIRLLAIISKSNETQNPFVKNGFYLEPVLFHFLPQNIDTLGFYTELYNLDKSNSKFKLDISIMAGFKKDITNRKMLEQFTEVENSGLVPVLSKIDIKGLKSGNYHLLIDLIDERNEIVYSKYINFQRSNPVENAANGFASTNYKNSFAAKMPVDSLFYSLKALVPVTKAENSVGLDEVITSKNEKSGRYFLYRYWYEQNKIDPYAAYKNYMKYAIAVDKRYRSQFGYGFETDRGYTYLKYGMPSEVITRESEPTAPPYEIWFYDRIEQDDQRNIKFIFYIPSLAHNDYILLHSNCRGERNNPTWFYELYSKRNDSNVRNMKPDQIESFYNELKNSFDNNAVRLWEELK